MSDHPRITHHAGLRAAERALGLLAGCYERAAVAGSLRRGKPTVGDVELVLRPTFIDGVNLLDERVADLLRAGTVALERKTDGSIMANSDRRKALVHDGVPVDLYVVQPDRHWGPTLLIRTGPADANHVLVTPVGMKNREGLAGVLPRGLAFRDGGLWDGDSLLHTPEEVDVLRAVGLPWIPPPERGVERYQQLASGKKGEYVIALARWPATTDACYGPDGRPVEVRMPAPLPSGGRVEQMGMF